MVLLVMRKYTLEQIPMNEWLIGGDEREKKNSKCFYGGGVYVHFRFFVVAHRSLRVALPPSLVVDRDQAPRGGAQ